MQHLAECDTVCHTQLCLHQPVTAQSTAVTSEVSLRVRFILGIQTWVLSIQEILYHFQDFCWLTLQLAGGYRGSFCSAYMVFAIVSLAPFKITACLLDRNEWTGKAILSLLVSNWSPATLENILSLTPCRDPWPICTTPQQVPCWETTRLLQRAMWSPNGSKYDPLLLEPWEIHQVCYSLL